MEGDMDASTTGPRAAGRHHHTLTEPVRWLRNRSLPLLVLTVLMLVAHPFVDEPGKPAPAAMSLAMAAIPLLGLCMLGRYPKVIAAISFVILAALSASIFQADSMEAMLGGWLGVLTILLYLGLIILLANIVFKSSALVDDRVYGGIAVYLLLAIVFSFIHHRIGVSVPGAYANVATGRGLPLNWADYLYFSFTVFTTTGFGDIVPTNAFSRCACTMEGVIGVLFPAVLIARLINKEFAPSR
jgi:hypothetical protein